MTTMFQIIHPNAAGLDVGAQEVYACVPEGRDPEGRVVRTFGTYTPDIQALAQWLVACGMWHVG